MRKVGACLNKIEIIQNVIKNNGGIAKISDFADKGINKYEVAAFCKEGVIERIRRGFYQIPQSNGAAEEQLIHELLPQGIICVESALFHYGYSDFSPREWSIAVPRTASRAVKNIEEFPMKAYYIQKSFLTIGKTADNFNGVTLPVYDRERTICDCFKYRTKLDNEIFNKAANAYAADEKKNLANLSKYAKEMKLYTRVMNVMEVLLNATGNDFVTFEIKNIAPIAVAKKYAGIGVSLVARIKNTKTPFCIDFGVGDVIVPKQEKRRIPTQLDDFTAPTVNTYSLETTIAEKIDAILSLMEFSSRMKDYYDIYYLANKFDFDGAILTEALRKTFENRGHTFTLEQFEQVMAFGSDEAMRKKWKAFVRKIDTKTDDYSTVLKVIKAFLEKPFTTAVKGKDFTEQWTANNNEWR